VPQPCRRLAALRALRGHRIVVRQGYRGECCDLLVALHARRSSDAVEAFRDARPGHPIIVALTGTDLYDEIHTDATARRALELASRLVVLQPLEVAELPGHLRGEARVVYQSTEAPRGVPRPREGLFEVCVLGHLRPVKDPFRTRSCATCSAGAGTVSPSKVGRYFNVGDDPRN
jgi:hypothetical protein